MEFPSPPSTPFLSKMRRRSALGLGLLSVLSLCKRAPADEQFAEELSRETMLAFSRFERAVQDLNGFLTALDFQKTAFLGVNYFGVAVGGIDGIKDLEESRGVDPETFSALYAGFAIPEVAKHLNLKKELVSGGGIKLRIESPDGRLRYKGAAVRLYSPDRLRELFDRQASFRVDEERKRTNAFTKYVVQRQLAVGRKVRSGGDSSETTELSDRYRRLKTIIADLETAIQSDGVSGSVLQGSTPHFFSLSIGGIDVPGDLANRRAVDPETMGAILADRVSPDYADRFSWSNDGKLLFEGEQIKMYPIDHLEKCFKRRQRLLQMAKRP